MQTKIKGLGWANLNPGAAVEGNNYQTNSGLRLFLIRLPIYMGKMALTQKIGYNREIFSNVQLRYRYQLVDVFLFSYRTLIPGTGTHLHPIW